MKKFGVVGCGKMGSAIMIAMKDVIDVPIICCDIALTIAQGLAKKLGSKATATTRPEEVAQQCDVVLLAVKPDVANGVLRVIGTGMKKVVFSIVAGFKETDIKQLSSRGYSQPGIGFYKPGDCEVVRMMPNTPALVGASTTVILDNGLTDDTKKLAEQLFSHTGKCFFVTNESQMDIVTGLSGSGPALFAMMAEALADAGVAEGLSRDMSLALARQTMLGTAKLLDMLHPAILKENVMSPGGTTAAGVLAAEKAGFRAAVEAFVRAATKKSRDLSH